MFTSEAVRTQMSSNSLRIILLIVAAVGCLGETKYYSIRPDHGLSVKSFLQNRHTSFKGKSDSLFPKIGMAWFKEEQGDNGMEYYVKVYFRAKFKDGYKTCTTIVRWQTADEKEVTSLECGEPGASFEDDKRFYDPIKPMTS